MAGELLWVTAGMVMTLLIEGFIWMRWGYRGPGSLRDYIAEEDEPEGPYRIVQKIQTPNQKIALVEHNGDFLVYANGWEMFSTNASDERYAEALVHVPMALAEKRERILIIGGGGGITTREALRYDEVVQITTVDIDEIMIDFGKRLEPLVRFNRGSLNHPKVTTVAQDGRTYVESHAGVWDVIILDLPEPSPSCPGLKRLFSREFYRLLRERLAPGGVLGVACSNPTWVPEYFWSVHATLKAAGFHVLPYRLDTLVEEEDDWGFCVAATKPMTAEDVRIRVPVRYLTAPRLKELFQFPYGIARLKCEARVQTDQNNVLSELAGDP